MIDGLAELGFGEWEGLTVEEVRSQALGVVRSHLCGRPGPSDGVSTGRILGAAHVPGPGGDRFDQSRAGLLTAVVTHGAAIRSYLADLAGTGWAAAGRLETPANSSVTHLVLGERGARLSSTTPRLSTWNR